MKKPTGFRRVSVALALLAVLAPGLAFGARQKTKRFHPRAAQATVPKNVAVHFVSQKSDANLQNATPFESQSSPPMADSDPEQKRYDGAKAKAKEDNEVKRLKAKADGATSGEEARLTSIAYNRALFRKMRLLDRSIAERINLVEAAILKRFD